MIAKLLQFCNNKFFSRFRLALEPNSEVLIVSPDTQKTLNFGPHSLILGDETNKVSFEHTRNEQLQFVSPS